MIPAVDNQNVDNLLNKSHEKIKKINQDEIIKYVITDRIDRDWVSLKPLKDNFNKWGNLYEGIQNKKNYDGLATF